MKNLVLFTLFVLFMATVATNNAFTQLKVKFTDPKPTSEGTFEITGELQYNYSEVNDFYLDISFPNGVEDVTVSNKYDWTTADVFKPGDKNNPISHKDGTVSPATYYLVSAHVGYFDGYQNLHLKVQATPNISGEIKIYYRVSRVSKGVVVETDPSNSTSGTKDQQGWRVYTATHTATSNQAPTVTINTPVVTGQSVSLTWDSTDPEGDAVTYSYKLDNGSWSAWNTRTYKQYDNLSEGSHTFYVKCKDVWNEGNTDSKDFTIAAINHPPIVTLKTPAISGQTVNLTWSGTDADGDAITYSYKLDDGSWSSWGTAKSKQYDNLSEGSHTFYVKCKDSKDVEGNTDSKDFKIIINHKPILNPIADKNADCGELLEFFVSATDQDGDALTYSVQGNPSGSNFNSSTGKFSWTPNQNQVGQYQLTFSVNDGKISSDQASMKITIDEGVVTALDPEETNITKVQKWGFSLIGLLQKSNSVAKTTLKKIIFNKLDNINVNALEFKPTVHPSGSTSPTISRTEWINLVENDPNWFVKYRYNLNRYTTSSTYKGDAYWPELVIADKAQNVEYHIVDATRLHVEPIGDHTAKLTQVIDLREPFRTPTKPLIGKPIVSYTEQGYKVFTSLDPATKGYTWEEVLTNPDIVQDVSFDFSAFDVPYDNTNGMGYTSLEEAQNAMKSLMREEGSFQVVRASSLSSAKIFKYLNTGGKILGWLGVGIVVYDIGQQLYERNWSGAVCTATSFGTSYAASAVVFSQGQPFCAASFTAGGWPGAICEGGFFVASLGTGIVTYLAVDKGCNAAADYVKIYLNDQDKTEAVLTANDFKFVKTEMDRLGYNNISKVKAGDGNTTVVSLSNNTAEKQILATNVSVFVDNSSIKTDTMVSIMKGVNSVTTSTKFLGDIFQFMPDGLSFTKPAVVRISYSDSLLKARSLNVNDLNIVYFNVSGNRWEKIETARDTVSRFVYASISHFSQYSLGVMGTTDVETKTYTPIDFTLSQNFPNPFNPSTTITYSTPKTTLIKIVIYDVLGKEIRTLEDKYTFPGSYQIVWDGKDGNGNIVPSGLYLYQLRTNDIVQTKKMTLLK